MKFPQSDFWDFSVTLYGTEGVHAACVALQAKYALDVNLLFYGLWHASAGAGSIAPKKWSQILAMVEDWHKDIVQPIWLARQKLKPAFADFPTDLSEPLRQMYINAELAAEHIEQIMLGERFPAGGDENPNLEQRYVDAKANVEGYGAMMGVETDFQIYDCLLEQAIGWPAAQPASV